MNSKTSKDFKEKDIYGALGNYALEFDGYCAADVVLYDDEARRHFVDDFHKYFYP